MGWARCEPALCAAGNNGTKFIALLDGRDSEALQTAVAIESWGFLSRETSQQAIVEAVRAVGD